MSQLPMFPPQPEFPDYQVGDKVTCPLGPGVIETLVKPDHPTYAPEVPDGYPRYGVRHARSTWSWFHPRDLTPRE